MKLKTKWPLTYLHKYLFRFSGLASAIKLKKKLGVTAEVFETSNDIGGTWKHSTYPGKL